MGDEETTRNVGQAFVREVDKQFLEDKPIWEHKAHLVRPALADNDGPFMKFRKWAAQFYAEGDQRRAHGVPAAVVARPRRRGARQGHRQRQARRLTTPTDVLVDPRLWPWRDRRWAHLVSDESYDELHAFAERLGIPAAPSRATTTTSPRTTASAPSSSAPTPVSSRELVRRLIDSGLRHRKAR